MSESLVYIYPHKTLKDILKSAEDKSEEHEHGYGGALLSEMAILRHEMVCNVELVALYNELDKEIASLINLCMFFQNEYYD